MTPFAGINRITSPYGYREYWYNGRLIKEQHKGQDIVPTQQAGQALPESAWAVREVTGGTVTAVSTGYNGGRGNLVKVQTAPGVVEIYQHLKTITVKVGKTVRQGDVIGVAGSTGQVTGRHLHFEVQVNGTAVEPSAWSDLPNKAATYNGNDTLDHPSEDVDKLYKATVLVDGLRLRPYPKADDFNANDAIATLVKGKVYDLKQTRNGWAFLLTDEGSGGWACIEDSNGKYLDTKEV